MQHDPDRILSIINDTGLAFTLKTPPLSGEYLAANDVTAEELSKVTAVVGAILSAFPLLPHELRIAIIGQAIVPPSYREAVLKQQLSAYLSESVIEDLSTLEGLSNAR